MSTYDPSDPYKNTGGTTHTDSPPATAVDDARVERVARVMYQCCTDSGSTWERRTDHVRTLWRQCARDVLTAAAAPDPAPAVDWQSEPPGEPGWYWSELDCGTRPPIWSRAPRKIIEDAGVLYQVNGSNDPRDVNEMKTRGWRWWPVPIPEPPARGGTP